MGIKYAPPITGDDCWCHPIPVGTPYIIYVHFWGIGKCPGHPQPPNGKTFVCYQNEFIPCRWESLWAGTDWKVQVDYLCMGIMTQVVLSNVIGNQYFLGVESFFVAEHDVIPNLFLGCVPNQWGMQGFCSLFWLTAAQQLVEDMNLPDDGKLMMEFFMKDDSIPVYKFCHLKYSINHTIEIA